MGGKPQREHGVGDGDGDGSHRGDGRGGNDDNIAAGGSGGGDSAGGAAAESRPASSDGAPRLLDTRTDRRPTARCRRPRVDASLLLRRRHFVVITKIAADVFSAVQLFRSVLNL